MICKSSTAVGKELIEANYHIFKYFIIGHTEYCASEYCSAHDLINSEWNAHTSLHVINIGKEEKLSWNLIIHIACLFLA